MHFTPILVTLCLYVGASPDTSPPALQTKEDATLVVTLDTNKRQQRIEGFGASDCWSIQYVGLWPEDKRESIADLLFSMESDDAGQPTGIGLSQWRFNIGAGSSRDNNPETQIPDPWRRADAFYNDDFTAYDWDRQAGQRQFLQAAKRRGVQHFTAFAISPPVHLTKNGLAYCHPDVGSTNLREDQVEAYAVFLADVLERFRDHEQISFDYISPFNEPQWDWNGNSQEGCRYSVSDMRQVAAALDTALNARNLDTRILVCDSGELPDLYGMRRQDHNYVHAFFDPESDAYVGAYSTVAAALSGHSYFSCWPGALTAAREGLRKAFDPVNIKFVMSEFCILLPDAFWVPEQYRGWGNGRDLGMEPALWMARVIHHDLAVAEAVSWEWWLGVSPYDYKDGLVYCDKDNTDGDYYPSKMLWAMGNFSRFIRPGMVRVELKRSDNKTHAEVEEALMVSGYHCSDTGAYVIVFVNCAYESYPVCIALLDNVAAPSSVEWRPYITAETSEFANDCTPYPMIQGEDAFTIPPRAVVTLVRQ